MIHLLKIGLKRDCDLEQAGVKVDVLLDTSWNLCQETDTPIALVKWNLQKAMVIWGSDWESSIEVSFSEAEHPPLPPPRLTVRRSPNYTKLLLAGSRFPCPARRYDKIAPHSMHRHRICCYLYCKCPIWTWNLVKWPLPTRREDRRTSPKLRWKNDSFIAQHDPQNSSNRA